MGVECNCFRGDAAQSLFTLAANRGRVVSGGVQPLLLEREAGREGLIKAARQTLPAASGTSGGERATRRQGGLPDAGVGAVEILAHTSLAGRSDGRISCTATTCLKCVDLRGRGTAIRMRSHGALLLGSVLIETE